MGGISRGLVGVTQSLSPHHHLNFWWRGSRLRWTARRAATGSDLACVKQVAAKALVRIRRRGERWAVGDGIEAGWVSCGERRRARRAVSGASRAEQLANRDGSQQGVMQG